MRNRGALDAESADHRGFRIAAGDLRALRAQIRSCPQPGNPHCACAAHQALGRKDSSGRWAGLAAVELGDGFAIRR
jgi:hypothetical protein